MRHENARRANDGPSKSQGVKMQNMKMQDMKLQDMKKQDLKMQDVKIEGVKHYCLLALHLPGASSQRFNLV